MTLRPSLHPFTDPFPLRLRSASSGVTIAISNRNHQASLPRSIRSALEAVKRLRQQQIPAEVLVIDLGSQDGSLTMLRQLEAIYFEVGLRVLALPQNITAAAYHNLALSHSYYQFILFLEVTRALLPENIPLLYQTIQKSHAAALYAPCLTTTDTVAPLWTETDPFSPTDFALPITTTVALYDRLQLFDSGGFAPDLSQSGHEDWVVFLRLLASGRKLIFAPLPVGRIYDPPNPTSHEYHQERLVYLHQLLGHSFSQAKLLSTYQLNNR